MFDGEWQCGVVISNYEYKYKYNNNIKICKM